MAIASFKIKLLHVFDIAPGVKQFTFQPLIDTPWQFIPGQFVTLNLTVGDKKLKRSYSIASLPGATDSFDFAASYVDGGVASELLFNLALGSELDAMGPVGRLVLQNDAVKRYILMATGTGITPYRAMIPELARRIKQQDLQVVILQGVRTRVDLLYLEDFLNLQAQFPEAVKFLACLSRENTPLHDYERAGYVSAQLAELQPNSAQDIIYLCGNPNMIDTTAHQLKELGFDHTKIRREKYFST